MSTSRSRMSKRVPDHRAKVRFCGMVNVLPDAQNPELLLLPQVTFDDGCQIGVPSVSRSRT